MLIDALTCLVAHIHTGVAAENIVGRHDIAHQEQDDYAARSYAKAVPRSVRGSSKNKLSPFEIEQRRVDPIVFDIDEDPCETISDSFSALRPAFS